MKRTLLLIGLGFSLLSGAQTPVAYYPFNGNANDESGNGYHGMVAGAALTTDRFGNPNAAYEFHGGNGTDSINCGHIPELVGATEYSVSCWLSQDQIDVEGGVWNFADPNGGNMIQVRTWNDGSIYGYQGGFYGYDYSQNVSSGTWFHLVYVFDNTLCRFYINGVEVTGTQTGGTAHAVTQGVTANFCIGSDNHGYVDNNSWDGKIDDMYVYDVVLTPNQIDSLFRLPNPNPKLNAAYYFDGNAQDSEGNNDATVYGAALTTDRFGNVDHAYHFDGVDDSISLGSGSELTPAYASVSLWFKWDANATTNGSLSYDPIIIAKNESNGSYYEGYGIGISRSTNELFGITTDFGPQNEVFSYTGAAVGSTNWHHIVITYDTDSSKMYIDGNNFAVLEKDFLSVFNSNENVILGASNHPVNFSFFNGSIDDVLIYNYPITPTEVMALYNAPNPTIGVFENEGPQFHVYPNPAQNQISFDLGGANTQYSILSMSGQTVLNGNTRGQIDVSELSKGMYLVQLQQNNKLYQARFIKE